MKKIKIRIKGKKEDRQVTLRAGDCVNLYSKGTSKPFASLTFQKGEYIYVKINPEGRDTFLRRLLNNL